MATYFAGVTLFDGRTIKTKSGVLVADGRISWVGPHARAPREARAAHEEEGRGRTLTPGLIDCHVHLCFCGSADFEEEARELTPTLAALHAAGNAVKHLDRGVTTVRDLGGVDSVVCEVARAIDRGIIPGSRVVAAGRALTITGGHGHNIGLARQVDGPDAVRRAVREEIRGGARAPRSPPRSSRPRPTRHTRGATASRRTRSAPTGSRSRSRPGWTRSSTDR